MDSKKLNIEKNKSHYDQNYSGVRIESIIKVLNKKESFLANSKKTEISWAALYHDDFEKRLPGSKILELGCGDCVNAGLMAALGGNVTANDISDRSGEIIDELNRNYEFKKPIIYINGDITDFEINSPTFDLVVGKAFLHHLTIGLEDQIVQKVSQMLKPNGEARFTEPAINSKILDELRWAVPLKDRPSKLFQPKAFKAWEEADPHPHRDNSSRHFEEVGSKYFDEVEIVPLGIFERFNRLFNWSTKKSARFKQRALKLEKKFPYWLRRIGARGQLIIYRKPKNLAL